LHGKTVLRLIRNIAMIALKYGCFHSNQGEWKNRIIFLSWLLTRQMVIQNPIGIDCKKNNYKFPEIQKEPGLD
jgi:hypothetical protein